MVLKIPHTLNFLFFALVSISWASVSNDGFFREQYQKINHNIEHELYEENLILIERLVKQAAYQELNCYHKGKILHKIGVSYYLLNRESEAIDYYKDALLNVWKDCPLVPASEKANTIYNIGISYKYLNDLESAKPYIDKALYIFENDAQYPRLDLAKKYHGIGEFYYNLNDAFRAGLYYRNAINLYEEIDHTEALKFIVLNDLITMSMNFKDYLKAKEYIDEALSIHGSFPETIDQLDLSLVYLNAGTTYLELKEYEPAQRMAKKSLQLLNPETESFYYAIALEILAVIQSEKGNYDLAIANMNRVIQIREAFYLKGENKQAMASTYENLGDILIEKGDIESADGYLNKAFDILVPTRSFDSDHLPIIRKSKVIDDAHLIRLIELKVKIFEAKHKKSGAIEFLKKALGTQHKIDSVINRSLVSFQFEQSKLDFLNLKFEHYGKAVEDALKLYEITNDRLYLEEAYYFSSKTKAIVLQYELNQTDAFQSNVSEKVVQREKALREEMHSQQALLTEATTNQDSLLQAYVKAQSELDSYLKEIEQKEPSYFKERYAFIRPPQPEVIQNDLPGDMVVIEYFLSKDTIYSFWLTKDAFFPINIPYDTAMKTALDDFIAQCHNPNSEVSQKLSQLIFEHCLKKGLKRIDQDIKRICIIPDGQLHKLSFEALSGDNNKGPNNYLIADYAISYSYSVGLLFREQGRKDVQDYIGFGSRYSNDLNKKLKARKRFFGNENLTQLALSHEEIKRGAAIFDGETFIDKKATLENFLQYSADADIIHLSLHGLVDIDDPGRSCIIFDDNQEEFILSSQDLYGNRLNADLVLLSTCHSASGKIYNGEGVQGMSKSFLLGGAGNILSSLWNASEASSMEITTSFLKNVHTGKPMDQALHQAKLDYLSTVEPNKRHPYYWANFIILGEVDKSKNYMNPMFFMGAFGLLLLALFAFRIIKAQRKY